MVSAVIFLSAGYGLASCSGGQQQDQSSGQDAHKDNVHHHEGSVHQHGDSVHQHDEADGNTAHGLASQHGASDGEVTFSDESMNNAFMHYMQVKDALVEGDPGKARDGARVLASELENISGSGESSEHAMAIAEADNIDAQRIAFSPLSNDFAALVKNSELESGQVFVQNCPMAFNNEGGDWLAAERDVYNPYFGDAMLHCGSVTGVIE